MAVHHRSPPACPAPTSSGLSTDTGFLVPGHEPPGSAALEGVVGPRVQHLLADALGLLHADAEERRPPEITSSVVTILVSSPG
jgi:hypothetical protein